MEQRRLRLGDILDDYCPRERRLTNHAVVAMIEEDVKQTRCTTCDAEHAYKGGKLPRRRKKEETASALYKEVLAGHLASDATPIVPELDAEEPDLPELPPDVAAPAPAEPAPAVVAPEMLESGDRTEYEEHEPESEQPPQVEEGPVHRPLIRAQLPRIEGQKEERRLPEFTIRQRPAGGGHFRGGKPHRPGGHAGNAQGGNGNRAHGGPRFAGSRPGGAGGRNQAGGRGAGGGFRSGGGRKRSR